MNDIIRLAVFDFDNTLFRSPCDTPENKKIYEKHEGLPWIISKEDAGRLSKRLGRPVHPRRGWWGRAETLKPPLVPDPVPADMWISETMDALQACLDDKATVTLIMTGRHTGLKQEILRILYQGGFSQVSLEQTSKGNLYAWNWERDRFYLYLLGMDGPCPEIVGDKPQETFPWKVWIINQFRLIIPNLEKSEIWEDREEHVEKFRALADEFDEQVIVHHVRG